LRSLQEIQPDFVEEAKAYAGLWSQGKKKKKKKFHNLHTPPTVINMTKSGRLRWTEHVVRMEEMRNSFKILPR
jgi:hypothetical protein